MQDRSPDSPHGEQTGTIPFMATDLVRRIFRGAFFVGLYKGQKAEGQNSTRHWNSGDYEEARKARSDFPRPIQYVTKVSKVGPHSKNIGNSFSWDGGGGLGGMTK